MKQIFVTYDGQEYTLNVKDPSSATEVMEAALDVAKGDYKLAAKIWAIAMEGGLLWLDL